MTINNNIAKTISLMWIFYIIASLSLSLFFVGKLDLRKGDQWGNFYTIITSDAQSIENYLTDEKMDDFLSLNRSVIRYNDISSMKEVPLKDLSGRFDTQDPRFDPYMKNAAELFSAQSDGKEYELLYFESTSLSVMTLYATLLKEFSSQEIFWTISGFEPLTLFLPLLLFCLYIALYSMTVKGNWKMSAGLCGWIPFVFLLGFSALPAVILFSFLINRKKSPLIISSALVLTLLFFYNTGAFSFLNGFAFINGLMINLYVYFSVEKAAASKRRKIPRISLRKPEHELFSPVPIMIPGTRQNSAVEISHLQLPLALIFVMVVLVITLMEPEKETWMLPLPVAGEEADWTLEDIAQTGADLLSPAAYLTHVAFQEGFLYGTKWEYPLADKPLTYPVYEMLENSFSQKYEIQTDYSDGWFLNQVSLLNNDNPAKLLFSTETPGFVIKKSNHYNYQTFTLLKFSFSMLILLLLIFSDEKKYKNISLNVKTKLLRRNEQVA
jgi:hypothetical protein